MTSVYILAADLFSVGNSLVLKLSKLGVGLLVLVVGAIAAGHIAKDHPAGAFGVVLLALIPMFFLADPGGAASTFVSTVKAL